MVNAKDTGTPKMMAQASNYVAVTLLTDPFWMQRWKSPVLPVGKNGVWRRTCISSWDEGLTLTPHIVAIGADSQRKVQIQLDTFCSGFFEDTFYLLMG
jgi:hypothetical protein